MIISLDTDGVEQIVERLEDHQKRDIDSILISKNLKHSSIAMVKQQAQGSGYQDNKIQVDQYVIYCSNTQKLKNIFNQICDEIDKN